MRGGAGGDAGGRVAGAALSSTVSGSPRTVTADADAETETNAVRGNAPGVLG